MNCPNCGHGNRPGAAFCESCGTRLASACPACGAELRPGARFCDSCGKPVAAELAPTSYTPKHLAEKILSQRSALEGERRNVTVLFCDVQGYTTMSEKLDEEAVYASMQAFLAKMMDAVHAYEGTVNQFLGDGVMALFGAPVAHEDDARRAVSAALEIQRSLSDGPVRCRIGINTGPVVIGKIGDNLRMDYTAVGDTTNLAARLQSVALPGTVNISQSTYRAVRDYCECEDLGEVAVKGKSEPVHAYRVIAEKGVRTRFEAATLRGLTPLIGRDHELALLRGYWERAQSGQGQVVLLAGEAGVGKSRLLLEFRNSLGPDVPWRDGHCSAFGRKIPFLPINEILKQVFGIEETDVEAGIVARVDVVLAERGQTAIAPYLKLLLSVDPGDPSMAGMDPQLRRAGILNALRELILARGRLGPVVLVVEDLHWIDPQSEEALLALVDAIGSSPVLLIQTYRPGYASPLGERTHVNRIGLGGLSAADTQAMSASVLGTSWPGSQSDLPAAVRELVAAKSDGNPFFIEEVTRALVESGFLARSDGGIRMAGKIGDLVIPDTIQEVIMSRIDRLAESPRRALQLASVIGREFTVNLLDRISDIETRVDTLLAELKLLELIYEKAYFPELAYMFKHALTHDVAYASLLVERRRALHRVVGAAIEELYADRLAEQYEMLARHFDEGQEWVKALDYTVKAGDKANGAFANQQAIDYYGRALEIGERLGPSTRDQQVHAALSRGFIHFTIGDWPSAIADMERVRGLAVEAGNASLEAHVIGYRAMTEFLQHEFELAEASAREALAKADAAGNREARAVSLVTLFGIYAVIDRHAELKPIFDEVVEAVAVTHDPVAFGFGAYLQGLLDAWRGDYESALERTSDWRREVARRGLRLGLPTLANGWVSALALCASGKYMEAIRELEEVIRDCEVVGEVWTRARALNSLGWVYLELQDIDRGLLYNREGLEISRSLGDPEIISNPLLNIGDGLLAQGDLEGARACFEEVEAVVRKPRPEDRWMLWRYSQHLFHSHGELCLRRGEQDRAWAYAEECLVLAERSDSRKYVVKARRLKGEILRARGDDSAASSELEAALAIALRLGNPTQIWKTQAALGRHAEALGVIEDVARRLTDEALRKTFLESAAATEIRAAAAAG